MGEVVQFPGTDPEAESVLVAFEGFTEPTEERIFACNCGGTMFYLQTASIQCVCCGVCTPYANVPWE